MFDEKYANKYHNIILNGMFSKLQIKRLMNALALLMSSHMKLHYVERLNYLFLEYESDGKTVYTDIYIESYFEQSLYRILSKESKVITQGPFQINNYQDFYEMTLKLCIEHNIDFYDDTDRFENEDIKRKYNILKKPKEIKPFSSLEEILEYLDQYEPASYKNPEIGYVINKNKITHFPGYIAQDMRAFHIFDYLLDQGYINDKYYLDKNYIAGLYNEHVHLNK